MSINSASDARHFNLVKDKQLVSLSSKALTSGKYFASDVVSASKNEYIRNKIADISNAMLTSFKNANSSPKSDPKPWYKRLVKNGANITKKCVGGIESFTSQFDFTFSDGLDISGSLATLGFSVSGNYAIDTKGNITLQYSSGKTFGTDLISIGLTRSRSITDAMDVSQLLGEGASYGVSASKIFSCGVNIVQDGQYMDDPKINGLNLFGGIGIGQGILPITIQTQSSQTYATFNNGEYGMNIYEEIYDITNLLIDWAEK